MRGMTVIVLLIAAGGAVAIGFLVAFVWAVRTGQFDDVARRSRIAVETRYVGWGAGIVDLDNDGHPDVFVVTGNVYPEVEKKLAQYPNATPRAVFRNLISNAIRYRSNEPLQVEIGQAGEAL